MTPGRNFAGREPEAIASAVRDSPPTWIQATTRPRPTVRDDPYPIFGPSRPGYPHFEVADYIARLRDEVSTDKPIVGVLQLFVSGVGGRLPTKTEMRMHAYAAIVEGAQGLFWWDIGENGVRSPTGAAQNRRGPAQTSAGATQITRAMQNLKDLVTELDLLKPALLATPTQGALLDVSPRSATAREWRIAALRAVIPLVSNFLDRQWYQAELSALTASTPNESLSPMLHHAVPQQSVIRTRVTVVDGSAA